MARILPKRSAVAGTVPTTGDLVDHELAVNTADRRMFMRAGAAIVEIGNLRHFDGGDAASTYTTANMTFDGGSASG